MQIQYDIAFSIYFKHDFFTDGNLKSLVVKPVAETTEVLKRAGGLVKTFQNGMHVLYETFTAGKKRSREAFLNDGYNLKFLVHNLDTSFFNYTSDFNTDISCSYFFFENSNNYTAQQKGSLHKGSFVGKDNIRPMYPATENFFVKPFGIINIQLHKEMEERFEICFSGVSTYWCYVLTRDYLQELVSPAIVHKDLKKAFTGPEQVRLPENKTALAFFSDAPIAHRERPVTSFQLVEEYDTETGRHKVVLPALPGPNVHHTSFIKTIAESKGKNFSFIFI